MQLGTVDVVADLADQLHRIAEASRGDGLIGALAAGRCGESGADDGLADARDLRGAGHHVHGDAADDDDGLASLAHA